jgi:prevent-host-death family protein
MSGESVKKVGARELRHGLRAILERVWEGESFEITDRGKPVARLVPLAEREDLIARLTADGVLIPPDRPTYPLPKPLRIQNPVMSTDEAIAEQRDESRRFG